MLKVNPPLSLFAAFLLPGSRLWQLAGHRNVDQSLCDCHVYDHIYPDLVWPYTWTYNMESDQAFPQTAQRLAQHRVQIHVLTPVLLTCE